MGTLIITGGDFDEKFTASYLKNRKYNYIITVDNGTSYAEKLGLMPDMMVGDFDTMGSDRLSYYENKGAVIKKYNPEKDDTDTELAISEATKRHEPIDMLCATGGRIDHLLGSIHNLLHALQNGCNARIIDKCNIIELHNKNFTVSKTDYPGKYISFIPFSGEVKGIILKGFKYPLDGYNLKPGKSRCISNELLGDEGTVEFTSGCVIMINSSDVKSE